MNARDRKRSKAHSFSKGLRLKGGDANINRLNRGMNARATNYGREGQGTVKERSHDRIMTEDGWTIDRLVLVLGSRTVTHTKVCGIGKMHISKNAIARKFDTQAPIAH